MTGSAFVAGVAVGALLVAVAFRGFSMGGSIRLSAKAERKLIDELTAAEAGHGTGRITSSRAVVITHRADAPTIRLTDGTPEITVAGTTYQHVEDAPAEHRQTVIDELRLVRDTMPEPIRHQVDALLADQAAPPVSAS